MLLAYNAKNYAAGGCHDDDNPGLSPYGKELVREMNRVGMVVDGTHTSYRSTMEMIELSTDPVIFSHSAASGLRPHGRNITDDQIKACAESGGVVGVNGVGLFLSKDPEDISAAAIFRHIDYMADLVGHEHVGLGLDYVTAETGPVPEGHNALAGYTETYGVEQYPPMGHVPIATPEVCAPLTEEMIAHGYTDVQIQAVLGGNFMRVFRQVW